MQQVQERSGHLSGHGGVKLFYRIWEPERPMGSIILVHGLNEHIGRYQHVAAYFAQRGFRVLGLDQRGYGQSEGARTYVERFDHYLLDLRAFTKLTGEQGKPIMIGHSMGGLIAFRYAISYPETLSGVVLSSPMFGVKAKVSPIEKLLAPLIARLLPRIQMASKIPPGHVSKDPAVAKAYAEDPLVSKGVTPRWYVECTRAYQECHQGIAARINLPILFLQAGDDLLVDPEATKAIYQQVTHTQKAFHIYAGKYHEIFNDPGYEEVLSDIINWIKQQEFLFNV